jgi:hypothetical protein
MTITVTNTAGAQTGISNSFAVSAGAATKYIVTPSNNSYASAGGNVTITAQLAI